MSEQLRLRFDRIAKRKITKHTIPHDSVHTSILRDILTEKGKRHTAPVKPGTRSLIEMHNRDLVDFVKLISDGTYVPVEWPSEATHKLIGTSWNTEPTIGMPKCEYALSVIARPLKIKVHITTIKVRKLFPAKAPVYKTTSSLKAKQNICRFLVIAMKAKIKLNTIHKLTAPECDLLYVNLHRAHKQLKLRKLLS